MGKNLKHGSKNSPKTKAREQAKRQLEETLKRVGYTGLKARGMRSMRPDFPDYSVEDKPAPTSGRVGNGTVRRHASEHPDAKSFPVGHDHKQGPRLIVGSDDLSYLGGKKS